MKIAIITGMNYLNYIKEGNIAFALAHQVLTNTKYQSYFKNLSKMYKIIDNGAAELGESIKPKELLNAARSIDANEIWCPDKLYDCNTTLQMTKNFISLLSVDDKKKFILVGIPQGRTKRQWLHCYKKMLQIKEISVIAISKYSVESFSNDVGTLNFSLCRKYCIDYLYKNNLIKKPLHCAGANNLIIDEIRYYKKYNFVRSIDSNIMFKLGIHNIKIDFCVNEPDIRLNHDINELTDEQKQNITYNINQVKRCLNEL